MLEGISTPQRIRFGPFELDRRAGELHKHDLKIRLQEQPFQILLMLLERPGEVLLREEIRKRLWPNDTIVEFDHSINAAIKRLRDAIGESAEEPRYVETVARRGYRFIGEVAAESAQPEKLTTEPTAAPPQAVKRLTTQASQHSRSRTWAACVAIVVTLAGGVVIFRATLDRPASPQKIRSIVVLPLRNLSGDADQEYLAAGLTDMLTTSLAQMGAFDVIASTSMIGGPKGEKTTPQIARELNVDALVEGSVQRSGNRVLVTAQLIEGMTARHLWARSYERDFRDALALQKEVANAIAEEIHAEVAPEGLPRLAQLGSSIPEAQEAYLRARYVFRRGDDIKRSFQLFQQAIGKDPGFAAAYAELPFGVMMAGGFLPATEGLAQWRAAVTRALELDPSMAEAHRSYGVLLGYHDWNWLDAEREFKSALRLNPNLARAHASYGHLLVCLGRMDEGLLELRRADRLDPFGNRTDPKVAGALYLARRPDELMEEAKKMEDMDARLPRLNRGYAYQLRGEFDKAIHELEGLPDAGEVRTERHIVALAHAYASAGKTPEARRQLDRLKQLSKRRKVQAWWFASTYAALNDKERAFEWLDKAYQERPSEMITFGVSPEMDSLRSDPRYSEMLLRMRLPPKVKE